MTADFKAALRLVWLAVALVTGAAAAAPFVVPEPILARAVPVCESKRLYGRECWMCGTTRGFISMGRGDWGGAAQSNRIAIPLFIVFSANAGAAIAYLIQRALR